MKKGLLLSFVILLSFLYFFAMVSAADNSTDSKAYACLNDKITSKTCASLSSDEKVFSFLATQQCSNEVKSDSKYKSDIKYTAQALLGNSDSDAKDWLISQNKTTDSLQWLLQIDPTNVSSCTVSYESASQAVLVGDDKKVSVSGNGNCLSVDSTGYWLNVQNNPTCYNNLTISCNESFTTNLLYKKLSGTNTDTLYVSGTSHGAGANGETTEKVSSLCFKKGSSCDYETTAWASVALDSLGVDISPYMPYITSFATDNENLLPESFVYRLTQKNEQALLSKQINSQYWSASGDRYYDTALAIYPLTSESPPEKQNSIDWLASVQGSDGCWNSGNIKDTAFLLYSIWPKTTSSSDSSVDCENAGYYCSSTLTCTGAGGNVLSSSDYSCAGNLVCCTQQVAIPVCSAQNGEICNSGQQCTGTTVDASDTTSGQICCVQGICQTPSATPPASSSCEQSGGNCRSSCNSGEQISSDTSSNQCVFPSDVCCVKSTSSNSLWIWALLILIVIVILGIVFREKLKLWWFKFKSGFGKSSGSQTTGRPPGFPPSTPLRPVGRRMFPPPAPRRNIPRRPMPSSSRGEIDDILKKLKEMGK